MELTIDSCEALESLRNSIYRVCRDSVTNDLFRGCLLVCFRLSGLVVSASVLVGGLEACEQGHGTTQPFPLIKHQAIRIQSPEV